MGMFGNNGSSGGGGNGAGSIFHAMLQQYMANANIDQQNMEWQMQADEANRIQQAAPEIFKDMIFEGAINSADVGAPNEHGWADPRVNPAYQAQAKAYRAAMLSGSPLLQKMVAANMGEMARANLPSADKLIQDPTKMLTDDIKEYNLAKQQGYPGSFQDWIEFNNVSRRMQVNVGPTTVNNSTQSPDYEKEYDKQMGKAEFDEFLKLQKSPDSLGNQLRSFETIHQLLGDRGGFGGSQLAELKAMADRLGISVEDKDADQAAIALQNQIALDLRSTSDGAGMPGAMSDADRDFLRKQVPGIDMSPAGRTKLIEVKRRLYQRQLEMRDSAMEYAAKNNGRFDYRFYNSPEYLRLRDKPLFEDIDVASQNPQATARPSAPQPSGRIRNFRRID